MCRAPGATWRRFFGAQYRCSESSYTAILSSIQPPCHPSTCGCRQAEVVRVTAGNKPRHPILPFHAAASCHEGRRVTRPASSRYRRHNYTIYKPTYQNTDLYVRLFTHVMVKCTLFLILPVDARQTYYYCHPVIATCRTRILFRKCPRYCRQLYCLPCLIRLHARRK